MDKNEMYLELSKFSDDELVAMATDLTNHIAHMMKLEDADALFTKLEIVQGLLKERHNAK